MVDDKSVKERGSRFKPFTDPPPPGSMFVHGFNPSVLANPDANAGLQIQIYHIPTKQTVEFAAFITEFSDSFSSNWDSQEVFGRADPVMNFKNTTRNVSLSWTVPAADFYEAKKNMAEVNKLIQFLYPTYTGGMARTMEGSPLVKVQFQNLLASGRSLSDNTTIVVDARAHGLISAITSCTATPDLDAGFFSDWNSIAPDQERNPDPTKKKGPIHPASQWPKVWTVSLSFTVLHDHLMGDGFKYAKGFPYHTEDQAGAQLDAVVAAAEDFNDKAADEASALEEEQVSNRPAVSKHLQEAEKQRMLDKTPHWKIPGF